MVDAHPATGSPKHSRLTITITIIIKAINVIPIPDHEAILSGASEKLIIPSIAYLNNFQKFHFISSATRSTCLNGSQYAFKLIQSKIILERQLQNKQET